MKKKNIKKMILACGYHPTPELVAAVEAAIEGMVTPTLIEREFKRLAKIRATMPPKPRVATPIGGMPLGMPPKPIS